MGITRGYNLEKRKKLVYTTNEAAEILRVSSKTVSRIVNDGKLGRIHGMRNIRIPVDDVEELVADSRVYNSNCARSAMRNPKGERKCVSAKRRKVSTSTVRVSTGSVPTVTQAARGLGELLALPTKGKP